MELLKRLKRFMIINLVNFFIIITLVANVVILNIFWNDISALDIVEKNVLLGFLMIINGLLIIASIKVFYDNPIINLVYNIKKSLISKDKIDLKKSVNPDINYITSFFLQFLNSFKNIKTDFLRGKEIKGEVELAREIQEKLLNKKITPPPSLEIVAKSKPMLEIGGDSYDVIQSQDNYYIYVGDATGHGVGAGFIMVMVNALISMITKVFVSGAQIISKTNEVIKPRVKANLLMTMLLVRWNEKDKRLFMTGAGHEHLIIYKDKLKKCFSIKSGGLAIGMIKDIEKMIKEQEIKFEENDIIVLYTDGITDSINNQAKNPGEEKERFGEERLIKAIENSPKAKTKEYKTARSVFNNITIEVSKFMGYKYEQVDDMTLVTIQYKPHDYDINNDFSETISDEFITEWRW